MRPTATDPVSAEGLPGRLAALAREHHHLLKYLLIGASASALDVILFLALYNLAGTSAMVAHGISVPISVIYSFAVNARHNFRTTDHVALRLVSFAVVAAIGWLAGYGVIELASAAGFGANAGKILSLPVVFVIQFVLNSRITFRKPKRFALQTETAAS